MSSYELGFSVPGVQSSDAQQPSQFEAELCTWTLRMTEMLVGT